MLTKTDAIVLKSMKFRDTSKIVTFYTRKYGKIKGVAKGARVMKSKFGAALEPMTQVAIVLYRKEHRDLQLLSQCDIVKPYKNIHADMERMSIAMSVIERINQLTHEEEENALLYNLLVETMDELDRATKNHINLLYAFELRYAALFGFSPGLDSCGDCGRSIEDFNNERSVVFQLFKGAVLCPACAGSITAQPYERFGVDNVEKFMQKLTQTGGNLRVSAPTPRILQRLLASKIGSTTSLEFNLPIRNEIDATLRLYLRYHFEGLKPLRSLEIFQKILN